MIVCVCFFSSNALEANDEKQLYLNKGVTFEENWQERILER
jgi:hypothetical protein